jgi:hypothetical protein
VRCVTISTKFRVRPSKTPGNCQGTEMPQNSAGNAQNCSRFSRSVEGAAESNASMARRTLLIAIGILLWPLISHAEELAPKGQIEYQQLQLTYQRERLKEIEKEVDLRLKVFDQQRYTGWTILVLVALMSAGGFAFSIFLILKSSNVHSTQASDLEVTLQRIKLSSIQSASLVGLVVYLSSLTFLYLYMLQMYKVSEIPTESASPTIYSVGPVPEHPNKSPQ